jgi:hypothetical protein
MSGKSLFLAVFVPLFLLAQTNTQAVTKKWTRVVKKSFTTQGGVAVCPDGNIVQVATKTYKKIWIRKYSPRGRTIWTRTYKCSNCAGIRIRDVAVASDGSIYVIGDFYLSAQDYRIWLRKYSGNGEFQWMRTYDGDDTPGGHNLHDRGYSVAVAPDGSIYAGGETYALNGVIRNAWLRKYSPSGGVSWTEIFGGIISTGIRGISAPNNYDVFITGDYRGSGAWPDNGMFLRHHDQSGLKIWERTYDPGSGDERGDDVACDAAGNIYVVGRAGSSFEDTNILVRKYTPGGIPLWTRNVNGPVDGEDYGEAVAVTPDGTVYAAGNLRTRNSPNNVRGRKSWFRKYSTDGDVLWTGKAGRPHHSNLGKGIALGEGGAFYAVGTKDFKIWLRKYK